MKHKKAVRNVTVGALATGLAQMTGAGAGVDAASAERSPSALCTATFGERGPYGGPVVGEGPPGDLMTVTLGWDAGDWPDGLREVVTCLSVDGLAVPALTRLTLAPPNAGNLIVDLRLPPGTPGALVCQQSILVGKAEGRTRPTSAKCFKLRAAEDLVAGPGAADGLTPPAAGSAPAPLPKSGEVAAPLPGGKAANPAPAPAAPPALDHSTPPARAAFEAARGAARSPAAWSAPARPTPPAPAPAPALVPATRAGQAANELARTPADNAAAADSAGRAAAPKAGAPAASAPGAPGAELSARTALPRTGVGDSIPLAAAGGLMALGGAGIIFGQPRHRRRPA